jgi:hypothetical protein
VTTSTAAATAGTTSGATIAGFSIPASSRLLGIGDMGIYLWEVWHSIGRHSRHHRHLGHVRCSGLDSRAAVAHVWGALIVKLLPTPAGEGGHAATTTTSVCVSWRVWRLLLIVLVTSTATTVHVVISALGACWETCVVAYVAVNRLGGSTAHVLWGAKLEVGHRPRQSLSIVSIHLANLIRIAYRWIVLISLLTKHHTVSLTLESRWWATAAWIGRLRDGGWRRRADSCVELIDAEAGRVLMRQGRRCTHCRRTTRNVH